LIISDFFRNLADNSNVQVAFDACLFAAESFCYICL